MGKVNTLFFKKVISIMKKKEMATHFSVLTWKIPWTEDSGWLQSMGLHAAVYGVAKSQTQLSD